MKALPESAEVLTKKVVGIGLAAFPFLPFFAAMPGARTGPFECFA